MKKTFTFAAAFAFAATVFAAGTPNGDEIIFAPAVTEITTSPGATFELPFNLTNTVQCNTFGWYLEQTDNFSVVYDDEEEEYLVNFGERLTANYTIVAQYTEQSHNFAVIVYNATGKKMMPKTEGLFCTITLKTADNLAPGEYELKMINAEFCWSDGEIFTILPPDATIKVKVTNSGIDDLTTEASDGQKVIYDLMGRRVDNPTKGIYIVNGRKMVVK